MSKTNDFHCLRFHPFPNQSLKILKGISETINRRTDITMTKRKKKTNRHATTQSARKKNHVLWET